MRQITDNVIFKDSAKYKSSEADLVKVAEEIQKVISKIDALGMEEKLCHHNVEVKFVNVVRFIGRAKLDPKKDESGKFDLKMEVNINAFNEDSDFYIKNIIAHEITHLSCFLNFVLKGIKIKPHGKEFKKICLAVGGYPDPKITHFKTLREGKKPRAFYLYLYKTSDDVEYLIRKKYHDIMLKGGAFKVTKNGRSDIISIKNFVSRQNVRK